MLIIMGRNQKERKYYGESFTDVQGCTNIAIAGRKGAKTCRDALISRLQDVKERRRAGMY